MTVNQAKFGTEPSFSTLLSAAAYARMTELLAGLARERCAGRLVSLLEGGYDLEGLAESVEAHVGALVAYRDDRGADCPTL